MLKEWVAASCIASCALLWHQPFQVQPWAWADHVNTCCQKMHAASSCDNNNLEPPSDSLLLSCCHADQTRAEDRNITPVTFFVVIDLMSKSSMTIAASIIREISRVCLLFRKLVHIFCLLWYASHKMLHIV